MTPNIVMFVLCTAIIWAICALVAWQGIWFLLIPVLYLEYAAVMLVQGKRFI